MNQGMHRRPSAWAASRWVSTYFRVKQLIEIISHQISELILRRGIVLIAVDGVGGSGKTALPELLRKELDTSKIIQLDDIYPAFAG
jgi:hypothetical protein